MPDAFAAPEGFAASPVAKPATDDGFFSRLGTGKAGETASEPEPKKRKKRGGHKRKPLQVDETPSRRRKPASLFLMLGALGATAAGVVVLFKAWPEVRARLKTADASEETISQPEYVKPSGTNSSSGATTTTEVVNQGTSGNGNSIAEKRSIPPAGPSTFPPGNNSSLELTEPEVIAPIATAPPPPESNPVVEPEIPADLGGGATKDDVSNAREVLSAFINAKTIEERLSYVQSPDLVEKVMRDYYGRHPYSIEPETVEVRVRHEKLRPMKLSFGFVRVRH